MISHVHAQVKPAAPIAYEFHPAPKELARSKELSDAGFRMMAVLLNDARRRNGGGLTCAPNEWLAVETSFSERKVQRVLKELEALGLIRRLFEPSSKVQRSCIAIVWTPSQHVKTVALSTSKPVAASTSNPSPPKDEREGEKKRTPDGGRKFPPFSGERNGKTLQTAPPSPSHEISKMARRVGYSARAAIVQSAPVRKTAAQQIEELRRTSRDRAEREEEVLSRRAATTCRSGTASPSPKASMRDCNHILNT